MENFLHPLVFLIAKILPSMIPKTQNSKSINTPKNQNYFLICNIVDQHTAISSSIKCSSKTCKSLLTCSIPNLYRSHKFIFNYLKAHHFIINHYLLCHKICSNCCSIFLSVPIIYISSHQ